MMTWQVLEQDLYTELPGTILRDGEKKTDESESQPAKNISFPPFCFVYSAYFSIVCLLFYRLVSQCKKFIVKTIMLQHFTFFKST